MYAMMHAPVHVLSGLWLCVYMMYMIVQVHGYCSYTGCLCHGVDVQCYC